MNIPPAVTIGLITATEDQVVVGLAGDIDHANATRMHDDVLALIEGGGAVHLLLDFTGVAFCDSSGLSALVGIWRRLHELGGSLALTAVPANVAKALHIGGLDEIIPVHPA